MKKTLLRILNIGLIVLLLCGNVFQIIGGGYWDKFLYRYCGVERSNVKSNDSTVISWRKSLAQLDYDADIAFFGDSITAGGNWQQWFSEYKIINLGVQGNALEDMNERIDMLWAVRPEKVFIMGGINGITKVSVDPYVTRYELMIDEIKEYLPGVEIYIQSVLPISVEKGKRYNIDNETIKRFNLELQKMAEEKNCVYIDLYKLYESDGVLNPIMTRDGVHLKEEAYEPWVETIRPYIKR